MSINYIVEVYDLDRIGINKILELKPKTERELTDTVENLNQWYSNPEKYKIITYKLKQGDAE